MKLRAMGKAVVMLSLAAVCATGGFFRAGAQSPGNAPAQPWTAKKAKTLGGAVYDADGKVAGVVQLKVAKPNEKKRSVKVSGAVTLLDGKKRTMKAASFTVPSDGPVSGSVNVKGLGSLSLAVGDDGFQGSAGGYSVAAAKVGGKWTRTDAKVYAEAGTALPQGTVERLLPGADGVPVRAKGGKWAFDKAASIKYRKGALSGDADPKRPNLSAMKLTYAPKTGLFKGAFKLYAVQGGKLKKYTVKVTGAVVEGAGTGVGKLARPAASWRVTVGDAPGADKDPPNGGTDGGEEPEMVQLWAGGPYWATKNIGADKPEDSGYYFWWGDTVGYKWNGSTFVASDGSVSDFSFNNALTLYKDLATLQSEGWITSDGILAPEHDAAHVHLGEGWRMPTYQELEDLFNNGYWKGTTQNGMNGYIVSGSGDFAGNSIFLPCAGYGTDGETLLENFSSNGYFWSSVPDPDTVYRSYGFYFRFAPGLQGQVNTSRTRGFPIRPVRDAAE